jgi:hypothetical protein
VASWAERGLSSRIERAESHAKRSMNGANLEGTGGVPMETSTVITFDGPYLHVLLRDVLPPDWEEVRRDLEREIEHGARKVSIAIAGYCDVSPSDPDLLDLRDRLQAIGVPTTILA